MTVSATTEGSALAVMPVGRRTPRGTKRWYLIHAPKREQATCDKLRKIMPSDLMEDAFVMRKEHWRKNDGQWHTVSVPMYEEYFFVVTRDVAALDAELAKLSLPVRVARTDGNHLAPLSADAQEWYEGVLDADHVIRNSVGVIVDGVLHVQDGPLVGQEARIRKIDRHRRTCIVDIAEGSGNTFTERLAMDVPFKS